MQTPTQDAAGPAMNGRASPRLRGVIPPPQDVLEAVARDRAKFPPQVFDDGYAKRTLDDWTLWHYFEGHYVAYRSIPEGVEVLAVGPEEIETLLQSKNQEELQLFNIKQV